jgi:hypothetical protein
VGQPGSGNVDFGNYVWGNIADPGVWYYSSWGWRYTSRTFRIADMFENFLWVSRRAQYVTSPALLQPGDIIVADWGDGVTPPGKADGVGDHVMIVHHNLGNGDVVYCQHSDGKMRRLSDVRAVFYRAQFRLYHAVNNNSLEGLNEARMYPEVSHPEVYVHTNRGKFWVRSADDVAAWGGWGAVTLVPNGSLHVGYGGAPPVSGTMVRERNRPAVWLIEGWVKRWISTEAQVARYGGWPAGIIVPNGSLDFYWRGSNAP